MASKLAVQMFTLRDYTATAAEFESSLQQVAAMGYPAVQLSAIKCMNGDNPEVDAATAKKMLDDHGLRCIATHRSWPALRDELNKEVDFHKTLDCDFAAIGGVPHNEYDRTHDGYRKWLADAVPVIAKLKAEGIRFGHHNHSHEFLRPEPGGMSLEDILIEEGGADLMMELDLYWIAHAGANPETIVKRCTGRVPVIHLKDKATAPEGNDGFICPIGEGNLDWPGILPACEEAGVDWYAIEHDTCPRDPFDCLRSSFDYCTRMGI